MKYIWRDTIDSEMFHIGVKNRAGYSILTSIFVDGVYDLFGLSYEQFQLITTEPRPIELTLEILGNEI